MLEKGTAAAFIGFAAALVAMFILLPVLKRLKAKQEILSYVKLHAKKNGTATMGGIGFIAAFIAVSLLLVKVSSRLALVTMAITLAYGVIGFLDDYIKIRYRRNLGLTAVQKSIAQIIIAVIASVFMYTERLAGSRILLPFSGREIDIGWLIIPLSLFIFLGGTNGANLLDGLDGLAGSVTACISLILGVLLSFEALRQAQFGYIALSEEYEALALLCFVMSGVLGAFLLFNCNPAAVFMGDTGSMALGAFTVCICLFSGNALLIAFLGLGYVVTALSVIVQVLYFKISHGKRLLLMAPLHHHLQMKGLSETRIAAVYSAVTLVIGGIILLFRCKL